MKAISFLTVTFAMAFSAFADPFNPLQIFSPRFSTNTQIIWEVPTNHLPQSFWIYRRILPHIFPETVISNAIVLGSLQKKGFPKSSTNDFYINEDFPPNYPGTIPTIFGIIPGDAFMYYGLPNDADKGPYKDIPNDETVVASALNYSSQFGLDPAKLVRKSFYTDFNVDYQSENWTTNGIRGRGVFFSRQLDGFMFFSGDDQGDGAEGFSMEFGSNGKVRAFSIRWSDVERYQNQRTATPQEIIQCIRAQKVMILPDADVENFFAKIKQMANAKKFIITNVTPYYTDSHDNVFGEVPENDNPSKFITPYAELEAVADFGSSNMIVHAFSPIISSDVHGLLVK